MASVFELVATAELSLLYYVILFGNAFRAIPASPANACGSDLHPRVLLAHHYLLLTAVPAGVLLLAVMAGIRVAEAAAARAAANRRVVFEGLGSVPAGWKRRSLRGMLLLAVVLSFSASVFADVAFEDGFLYRIGCHAGYGDGAGAPLGVLVMGISAFLHAFFAWDAVTQY